MSSDNFLVALDNLVHSPPQKKESSGLNNKDLPIVQKWLQTIYVMEDVPFQEIRV